MDATIVFDKIWKAIHAKNEDGTRKYKYIINTGSSRSSKTFSILQSHYLYALSHSNKRISIWRETKQDTKNTVLADFKKAIVTFPNNEKVTFNKTESIYTFDNGSTIEICGGDDENRVHGFQGNVAHFNEPYKISEDTFNQIDMRTSDYILIDWNPKSGHWIDTLAKLDNAIVIHSTFKDNPFCPPEQRKKILSYQPTEMSEVVMNEILTLPQAKEYNFNKNTYNLTSKQLKELERCLYNDSTGTSNLFNWQVYGLGLKSEKPNRIFKWTEISDSEYHNLDVPVYYGCDWGAVDPWAIVEAKYYDGCLYLHELNYTSENVIRTQIDQYTRNEINNHSVNAELEEGIVIWMFNKLKVPKNRPIICDSNRVNKIAILRRFDYQAEVAYKGTILDRIDLLNNLKVFYTKSSTNIAYEQENYSRKVDRYGIVLDEPEDKDNHLMDATGYISMYLQREEIIRKI
jgi:phage terminase large subunit